MNCVILAAGVGSRMRSLTAGRPKCLVKVRDTPVIDFVISSAKEAGIQRMCIVVGHLGEQVVEYTSRRWGGEVWLDYVWQNRLDGTASALALALAQCRPSYQDAGHLFVGAADYVMPRSCVSELVMSQARSGKDIVLSLGACPLLRRLRGGVVKLNSRHEPVRLYEKPSLLVALGRLSSLLLYVLPLSVERYCKAVPTSVRGERELPVAIDAMLQDGVPAGGIVQSGVVDLADALRQSSSRG